MDDNSGAMEVTATGQPSVSVSTHNNPALSVQPPEPMIIDSVVQVVPSTSAPSGSLPATSVQPAPTAVASTSGTTGNSRPPTATKRPHTIWDEHEDKPDVETLKKAVAIKKAKPVTLPDSGVRALPKARKCLFPMI